MDIISLSKANRVIQDKHAYHQNEVGFGVEAHFASLDDRLDFLEGAGNIPNLTEVIQLLQENAVMINTEFEAGVLKLKHMPLTHPTYKKDYVREGRYEKIFDLSGSYVATQLVTITKAATANQEAIVEYATSEDGVTYSTFAPLLTTSTLHRYVHLRIILKNEAMITISYDYDATLEEAARVRDNLLITSKTEDFETDTSWTGEGSLVRKLINEEERLRIDKMNVLIK